MKQKLLFVFISLFINVFKIHAYKIKSEIKFVNDSDSIWKIGEIRTAKLTIWPIKEIDNKFMANSLLGNTFVDHLFVSKIYRNSFSENNPEAYEILFDLTLIKKIKDNKLLIWSYKGINIPIRIKGIKTIEVATINKEITTIRSRIKEKQYSVIYIFLLALVIIVIIAIVLRKNKTKEIEEVINWKDVLLNAQTRTDFEMIYNHRIEWMKALGGENPQYIEFVDKINSHQYKEEWQQGDFEDINFIFGEIKESLENVQ